MWNVALGSLHFQQRPEIETIAHPGHRFQVGTDRNDAQEIGRAKNCHRAAAFPIRRQFLAGVKHGFEQRIGMALSLGENLANMLYRIGSAAADVTIVMQGPGMARRSRIDSDLVAVICLPLAIGCPFRTLNFRYGKIGL